MRNSFESKLFHNQDASHNECRVACDRLRQEAATDDMPPTHSQKTRLKQSTTWLVACHSIYLGFKLA